MTLGPRASTPRRPLPRARPCTRRILASKRPCFCPCRAAESCACAPCRLPFRTRTHLTTYDAQAIARRVPCHRAHVPRHAWAWALALLMTDRTLQAVILSPSLRTGGFVSPLASLFLLLSALQHSTVSLDASVYGERALTLARLVPQIVASLGLASSLAVVSLSIFLLVGLDC